MDDNLILAQYKDAVDKTSIFSKTDVHGIITYINDKFCEISGYTREELIGSPHSIVRHPDTPSSLFKFIWGEIQRGRIWQGVIKNRKKGGGDYYVHSTIYPIKKSDGTIVEYISIRQDITEIVHDKKLLKIYSTDQITNLPNRQKLLEKLAALEDEVMVLLLDIKDFGVVNELYGEEVGNAILQKTALNIKEYIVDKGIELYKLHADQYLIFVEDKNLFDKYESLAKFSFLQEENFIIDDIVVSFQIGIAYGSDDLLNKSSLALRQAKDKNSGYFIYDDTIDTKNIHTKNIQMFNTFKDALEENRVEPYFQPIVDAKTEKIIKYEALARLIDKEGNIVGTDSFMAVVEKSRFFENFTRQIIQKIFAVSAKSNKEITINVTYNNLNSVELVKYIENRLQNHNGGKITFEILESEDIQDYEILENFIKMVKTYGCDIAIDDFGSGYSNFLHLVRLQPDFLKLDGSIISKIGIDKKSENIVAILVGYAKMNNIKIVAEYVSNENIAKILKNLGVDLFQGYYYGQAQNAHYYGLD